MSKDLYHVERLVSCRSSIEVQFDCVVWYCDLFPVQLHVTVIAPKMLRNYAAAVKFTQGQSQAVSE